MKELLFIPAGAISLYILGVCVSIERKALRVKRRGQYLIEAGNEYTNIMLLIAVAKCKVDLEFQKDAAADFYNLFYGKADKAIVYHLYLTIISDIEEKQKEFNDCHDQY